MKVLIWGCGARCRSLIARGCIDVRSVYGFIDSKPKADMWEGKKVYHPQEVESLLKENVGIVYIIVTTQQESVCREIYETAVQMNIPDEKLLFVYNRHRIVEHRKIHKQSTEALQDLFPNLFREMSDWEFMLYRKREIVGCGFDLIDSNILIGTEPFSGKSAYLDEYVRYRTFELAANEIKRNRVDGAVAEIGVFRGIFAKMINAKFPDRKLYLFDSFESFKQDEFEKELEQSHCNSDFYEVFLNTNADTVMRNMLYPENCIIRKGFFPESLREEDKKEHFAFVSMDVDLEESSYQCLKHIYPLVTLGGYIFLHDYNNRFLGGIKKAVQRYEGEIGMKLKKVPICDEGGTIIIVK